MNKKELRKLYLAKRENLSEDAIDRASRAIAEQIVEHYNFDEITCVHVFLPSTKHQEINTWHFINLIRHRHPDVKIVIPQANYSTNEMVNCLLESDTHLVMDKFGIPEPEDIVEVKNEEIKLVIVPLVVADKNGGRVGYGKGFYDRFFLNLNGEVQKVGVSFFDPVNQIEDLHENDISLDSLLTTDRFFEFN